MKPINYAIDAGLAVVSPLLIKYDLWQYYLIIGILWAMFCITYSQKVDSRKFIMHLLGWVVIVPYASYKWIHYNRGHL